MDDSLGDRLVANGMISEAQLASAHEVQESIGGQIGTILTKLGYVNESKLLEFVARQEGLQTLSIHDVKLSGELMITLPRELMENHDILPIKRSGSTLTLALADPTNVAVVDEVRFITGLDVATVLMPRRQIQKAVSEFFHTPRGDSGRSLRVADRHTVHALAREIGEKGTRAVPPKRESRPLAIVPGPAPSAGSGAVAKGKPPEENADASAGLDALGVPPVKIMKALAALLIEKKLVTLDEVAAKIEKQSPES